MRRLRGRDCLQAAGLHVVMVHGMSSFLADAVGVTLKGFFD